MRRNGFQRKEDDTLKKRKSKNYRELSHLIKERRERCEAYNKSEGTV